MTQTAHAERPLVVLRQVSRAYREGDRHRSVLRQVDFQVARGECIAVLGRSGSGKSTLLNLISGIEPPSAGEVSIAGENLTRMGERERTLFRRRHIGFVHQFFNLLPTLTVEENVALPLELNRLDRRAAARLLAAVALADRASSYPDRLSGGEQQRIAIARALVHDPSVVLADEPTGNLDAETGRAVLALFNELVRGAGKTLVLVTHAREVAAMADRIVRLEDGRLSASGAEAAW